MTADRRIVFGLHAVAQTVAVRPDEIEHLYVLQGRGNARTQALIDDARAAGVSVRFVDRDRLHQLCDSPDHQGVAASVASFSYAELEDLFPAAGPPPTLLLALDGVQDPRNLGAILRSAEALGAQGVVIPRDRAAGVTAVAAKVAAGAAERIPVARVVNLVRALEALRERGLWIIGAAPLADAPAHRHDFTAPTCLVIGGEEKGLRPLVRKTCDLVVSIPLAGTTASLNASIAAAVLLYEVQRQRATAR